MIIIHTITLQLLTRSINDIVITVLLEHTGTGINILTIVLEDKETGTRDGQIQSTAAAHHVAIFFEVLADIVNFYTAGLTTTIQSGEFGS